MTKMLQTLKSIRLPLLGLVAAAFTFFFVGDAMAQFITPGDSPESIGSATGNQGSFREIVLTIVEYALKFLGLLAVIMIIYGGFLYVTSAGDTTKTDTAKKIIIYAIIGIIVILVSYALVNTILGAAQSGNTQ